MSQKIYNSATRRKEIFKTIQEGKVGIYVCGITAYDICHIGHARSAVFFDVVVRHLRSRGYHVTYVKNFTDIDDKIIERAKKEDLPIGEISERYIALHNEDMASLNVQPPTLTPKATEHIQDMIELISILMEKGYAYCVQGNVYFSVEKFSLYGIQSGRNLEEMVAGARVDVNEEKNNPLDFALWKVSKPGEPSWESPWGKGRPGWHIECSAMSRRYLGDTFDIHGGGEDLIFPHHENEIAQAEAYTGISPFSRYWIHTGWVTLNREKMSKSIGNVFLISEALKVVSPNVLRFFFIETLYSSPLEYNIDQLHQAGRAFERIVITMQRLNQAIEKSDEGPEQEKIASIFQKLHDTFHQSLSQNFNTPQGIAVLMNAVREVNKWLDMNTLHKKDLLLIKIFFDDWFDTLGLVNVADTVLSKEEWDLSKEMRLLGEKYQLSFADDITEQAMIMAFIDKRNEFRQHKQYLEADEIRNDLYALKIQLEDKKDGTEYRFIP